MRRLSLGRTARLAVVSCVVIGSPWAAEGAAACEGESPAPTIAHTSLTSVTEAGVTVEAQINPQGSETTYEFLLVWQDADPPAGGEPVSGGTHAQTGHIAAGFEDQTVSALLTDLQPGCTYWYEVVASNSGGKTKTGPYSFAYLNDGSYPYGTGSGPPYKTELSQCAIESGDIAAARVLQEAEQRRAKEAAAKAAEEAAHAVVPVSTCTLPSLKGDTLSTARRVVARAHCRLGRVSRPHRYRGALIVTGQSPGRGRKLADGTAVSVRLGPSRRR